MNATSQGFSGLMQCWAVGVVCVLFASGCAATASTPAKPVATVITQVTPVTPQQRRHSPAKAQAARQTAHTVPHALRKPPKPATAPAHQPPQTQAKAKAPYQLGMASYYGKQFHGRKTASGERYDQNALTCAHGSLPFGCRLRVTNLRNNKSVEVKVNDRGGFSKYGRVIDLSKAAAKAIGMLSSGTAKVQIEVLE